MKKVFFYLLIIFLYLLAPVSFIGILGTWVSQKYEVQHGRIFLDSKDNLSELERNVQHKEIDELEQTLRFQRACLIALLITGLILPTSLLLKRAQKMKNKIA